MAVAKLISAANFLVQSATSLKLKKVLSVAQGPRLRAFFNFASSRLNHQIFALKAVSRQPLSKFKIKSPINDELADGAAELMNIIFGTAKTALTNEGLSVDKAIPSVVRGENMRVNTVTGGGRTIVVPFSAKDGTFHVLISLGKAKPELKAVK